MLILDKSRSNVEQLRWRTWPKFRPKIGCGTPELRERSKVYGSGLCTTFRLVLQEFSTREKRRWSDWKRERDGLKGQNIHHAREEGKQEKKKKNQSEQERKGIRLRLSCVNCYPKQALKELTQKRECRHEGSSSVVGETQRKTLAPKPPLCPVTADTIAWVMVKKNDNGSLLHCYKVWLLHVLLFCNLRVNFLPGRPRWLDVKSNNPRPK